MAKNTSEPTYRPVAAIIIHKAAGHEDIDSTFQYYCEYSEIVKGVANSYKPLRVADLTKLYIALKHMQTEERPVIGGRIPSQLLYHNQASYAYVWTVPGQKRKAFFSKEVKGIKEGIIKYPNMLFVVEDENLYVYIYKDEVITAKTKFIRAPFMNTYDDGNICLGNINLQYTRRAKTYEDYLQAWEDVFFKSKFSQGAGGSLKFMKAILNRRTFPWAGIQTYLNKKLMFTLKQLLR